MAFWNFSQSSPVGVPMDECLWLGWCVFHRLSHQVPCSLNIVQSFCRVMVIWAFGVSTFWYILILLEILEIGFFSLMALLYPLCQLFGHFRPDIIFCLGPVCVRLCLRLKMPFLQPTRTRGLAVPVDVSLYGVTSSPNVTSCIVSPFGIFPSL